MAKVVERHDWHPCALRLPLERVRRRVRPHRLEPARGRPPEHEVTQVRDRLEAEELIAVAGSLEQLENAAIGTADNRWRIPRMNGQGARAGSAGHGEDLAPSPARRFLATEERRSAARGWGSGPHPRG